MPDNKKIDIEQELVKFIDIVFSVIIGKSLWDLLPSIVKGEVSTFNIFVLFVSYWSVVLSWIGYHKSIKLKAHKGIIGWVRFALDLLILIIYIILIQFYYKFE